MNDANQRLRLAVLLSGSGRTLMNLHERTLDGSLPASIHVVVSSRGDVTGVEKARRAGLPTVVVERKGLSVDAFNDAITRAVEGADLVCMAGFLSLWRIPDAWRGRVINIHPALLPEFGGKGMFGHHVHDAVLAARKSETGCTVHFCDNHFDHGDMILQRRVPVLSTDTPDSLAARVFEQECIAYPEAIRLLLARRSERGAEATQ